MKSKLAGLLKDKKQLRFWIWLAVLCVVAGVTAALFYLYYLNGGKVTTVFALGMKGKKTALLIAAVVAVLGLVLGTAIRLLKNGRGLRAASPPARWAAFGVYAVVQPFVLLVAGELPVQGVTKTVTWLQTYFHYYVWGWLWLVLVYLLLACLVNGWFAALLTGAVTVIPGIISYFKAAYRGNPLFPWDIYALDTVGDIAGELTLTLTAAIVLAVALWALMVIAAVPVRLPWRWRAGKAQAPNAAAASEVPPAPAEAPAPEAAALPLQTAEPPAAMAAPPPADNREQAAQPSEASQPAPAKRRPPRRLWAVLCAALLVVGTTWVVFFSSLDILPVSAWNAVRHYARLGQTTAFLNDIKMLTVNPPAGYSPAAIDKILADLPTESTIPPAETAATPHIILVMSESFWDMEQQLTGVQFEEPLLPNFHAMQAQGLSGNLLVSSLSGGTSLSEFQVLTGFSAEFFPSEYTPYMQAVRQPFFSYAHYLKQQGYTTLAMHPHRAYNWNRSTAYPYLGFDTFYATRDGSGVFDRTDKERGFVSDKALVQTMIGQFEAHIASSDAPLFLFAVTMQNHTPYKSRKYAPEDWVSFEAPGVSAPVVDQLLDYATGLHSADAALGDLLAYFEGRDEPVLVVYFGDHMSFNASLIDRTMLEAGPFTEGMSALDYEVLLHQTPFAAWSNQQNTPHSAGTLGAYNLLPVVLESYGLPMPRYFEYLLEMRADAPGFALGIALGPDGGQSWVAGMNPLQQRAYRSFQLLQYDYIFGKQYAAELFPLS